MRDYDSGAVSDELSQVYGIATRSGAHCAPRMHESMAAPAAADEVVRDRRGTTLLVRNALFSRVRLAAQGRTDQLGALDEEWGYRELVWKQVLERFHDSRSI